MNMCNNHPNIVQAYDALIITDEKNRKRFCIIMEYCEYEFTIKAVRDFATNELKENLVKIILKIILNIHNISFYKNIINRY